VIDVAEAEAVEMRDLEVLEDFLLDQVVEEEMLVRQEPKGRELQVPRQPRVRTSLFCLLIFL